MHWECMKTIILVQQTLKIAPVYIFLPTRTRRNGPFWQTKLTTNGEKSSGLGSTTTMRHLKNWIDFEDGMESDQGPIP